MSYFAHKLHFAWQVCEAAPKFVESLYNRWYRNSSKKKRFVVIYEICGNYNGESRKQKAESRKQRIILLPLQGVLLGGYKEPRAVPWAEVFKPFRLFSLAVFRFHLSVRVRCPGLRSIPPMGDYGVRLIPDVAHSVPTLSNLKAKEGTRSAPSLHKDILPDDKRQT